MTRYLTPDRFRVMATGVDLSGTTNSELASVLSRGADLVDAYCLVPTMPQPYSFRGGTITDETHSWRMGQTRAFPRHRPVRSVQAFDIYATNNVYIDITPDDIFIEPRGNWLEIVALSMSPVGFWAATSLVSLTNPVLKLDYTYGYVITVTGEMLSTPDQFVYRAQNQFWLADPVIKVNDVTTSTGFTINRTEGTITFATSRDSTDIVTADYTHPVPSGVAQANAVISTSLLSERDLISKGLGNLAEIQVEEVRLRRDARRTGTAVVAESVPDAARALLAPYRYLPLGVA